jgi:hypothetical protein
MRRFFDGRFEDLRSLDVFLWHVKSLGSALEWLLGMRFCLRMSGVACARPADASTQYRSIRVSRVSLPN